MNTSYNSPTPTQSWKNLQEHFDAMRKEHLFDLFQDNPERMQEHSIHWGDFLVDFSKNRWTTKTIDLFADLASELELDKAIQSYFDTNTINFTEQRAVLHTALRSDKSRIMVDGENIMEAVNHTKQKIKDFTSLIINGDKTGYTGKPFTDVVNIGIGGSDLGPKLSCKALQYYKNHLDVHFVSNVDGDHLHHVLEGLNPETTLFIVASKSFSTVETLQNARTIRKWFLQTAPDSALEAHFVAVSANVERVKAFGIAEENVFPMWDWVGGRFSLWSAVGLPIALSLGYENFEKMLEGARQADVYFQNTPIKENIPVLMAFLTMWYNNFFDAQQEAVIPYAQSLEDLVSYLQQASMESNGKYIDRNGKKVDYQTGTVVFGGVGTDVQHAFMQLLHQGTKLIPADFIGFCRSLKGDQEHHDMLMANFFAQIEALAFGTKGRVIDHPYRNFEGNKPSTTILIKALTPETFGSLLAFYEHKIFTLGILWNINSYDQFGVELGKELSNRIIDDLGQDVDQKNTLMNFYNQHSINRITLNK